MHDPVMNLNEDKKKTDGKEYRPSCCCCFFTDLFLLQNSDVKTCHSWNDPKKNQTKSCVQNPINPILIRSTYQCGLNAIWKKVFFFLTRLQKMFLQIGYGKKKKKIWAVCLNIALGNEENHSLPQPCMLISMKIITAPEERRLPTLQCTEQWYSFQLDVGRMHFFYRH